MKFSRRQFCVLAGAGLFACSNLPDELVDQDNLYQAFDAKFWSLIDKKAEFQILGAGYGWSEGPAWDKANKRLYYTDVPGNIAYEWSEQNGAKVFLNPSGSIVTEGFREAGANGLLYIGEDQLLVCNHGERAVQSMQISTGRRQNLTHGYNGKNFNSPNDLIQCSNGFIYFTDPPYGLDGLNNSPMKELEHNGVYRLEPNGQTTLLIGDMTFPNGIALSPDQKTLYVSQSDPDAPHLYQLDLTDPGKPKSLLIDFSEYMGDNFPGLPDGMVVDTHGHIFATGPGGVFVIAPDGKILGRILTQKGSANCTFGEDGSTLFITNHDRLIKLKTLTIGLS